MHYLKIRFMQSSIAKHVLTFTTKPKKQTIKMPIIIITIMGILNRKVRIIRIIRMIIKL